MVTITIINLTGIGPLSSTYTISIYADPNLSGVQGGLKSTKALTLKSSNTQPLLSNPADPYLNYAECKDYKSLFKNDGITGLSLPFGPFSGSTSPLRPLCFFMKVSKDTINSFGDWSVRSSIETSILASGWAALDSTYPLPNGFTPLTFTGLNSQVGQTASIIQLVSSKIGASFNIITPQLQMNSTINAQTRSDFAILQLGTAPYLNNLYIPVHSFDAKKLILSATFPSEGFYLFGRLDNDLNTELPAQLGKPIAYLADYKKKSFKIGANLYAFISGTIDVTLYISESKASTIISSSNMRAIYAISFDREIDENNIIQIQSSLESGFVWAYVIYFR